MDPINTSAGIKKYFSNLPLILIMLAASVLRLYGLTDISLWHDEAFSALLIRYPLGEMLWRISLDVHPPFYYLLLKIWDLALGDSLFSLRLFSAFFGILTVYFAYLFTRDAFKNKRLALISAAFIAVNPFQIQYAVEARMYTLGTFLIVLSSWLLIKAIKPAEQELIKNACEPSFKKCDWLTDTVDKKSILKNIYANPIAAIKKYRWWILYGISAALAIYTHYYLFFSVAAQAIFVVFWGILKYGKNVAAWTKSQIVRGALIAWGMAFIIFFPWLGIFIKQIGQVQENYWIPKMDSYSIPNTLWKMLASSNIYINNDLLIVTLVIFLIIFITAMKREEKKCKYLVAASFIIPFLLAIALSFKRSLYLDRYFVFTGIFYLIIFAVFVNSIKKQAAQNILIAIFIIGSIASFIRNWQNIGPASRPGMGGAANYVFKNAKPYDKIYINSSFIYFTFKYYAYRNYFYDTGYPSDFNPSDMIYKNNTVENYRLYPNYLTPLLYTPGMTSASQIPHFSGAALLADNDLLTDFNQDIKQGNTIWLVWTTGFGSGKPEVPKNWIQIDEAGFEDVLGYRGWIVATKYQAQ